MHPTTVQKIYSPSVHVSIRLSRLTPVDDNIATSALSSDSEMDGLTMEAIESLAEKITAKDTPEDNVTPVQVSSSTHLFSWQCQEV